MRYTIPNLFMVEFQCLTPFINLHFQPPISPVSLLHPQFASVAGIFSSLSFLLSLPLFLSFPFRLCGLQYCYWRGILHKTSPPFSTQFLYRVIISNYHCPSVSFSALTTPPLFMTSFLPWLVLLALISIVYGYQCHILQGHFSMQRYSVTLREADKSSYREAVDGQKVPEVRAEGLGVPPNTEKHRKNIWKHTSFLGGGSIHSALLGRFLWIELLGTVWDASVETCVSFQNQSVSISVGFLISFFTRHFRLVGTEVFLCHPFLPSSSK